MDARLGCLRHIQPVPYCGSRSDLFSAASAQCGVGRLINQVSLACKLGRCSLAASGRSCHVSMAGTVLQVAMVICVWRARCTLGPTLCRSIRGLPS
jgi:hypothetical protein